MTLTEKIQTALIGADFQGGEDIKKELASLVGQETIWYDTVIADGADEDETEDQYVMRASFISERGDIIVHVYYGDVTEEISYVGVSEPAV